VKKLIIIALSLLIVGCCAYVAKEKPKPQVTVTIQKEKLDRWMGMLERQELTIDDFIDLMRDEMRDQPRLDRMREIRKGLENK